MKTIKISAADEPVVVIFSNGDTPLTSVPLPSGTEHTVVVEDGTTVEVLTPEEYAERTADQE